jgi:hypothetical protein
MLGHMSATFQITHLIRAGIAILVAWSLVFAVMFGAFYGYLPRQIETSVFLFSSGCVFPYEPSALSETAKMVLTISHWVLSILVFTFAGRRLPARWVFVIALITVPLLAMLSRAVVHLIGFR